MRRSGQALSHRKPVTGAAAWSAIAAWLFCTAGTFWFLEFRDWRSFSNPDAQRSEMRSAADVESWFRAQIGTGTSGRPHLTFVHLYSPGCRCNSYSDPHLERLMARYQSRGVRFLAALSPTFKGDATAVSPLGLPLIASSNRVLAAAGVDRAPAALIFDAAGRLIYYGPYSDSAWCGSAGGLVEPVLEHGIAGQQSRSDTAPIRGCFCPW